MNFVFYGGCVSRQYNDMANVKFGKDQLCARVKIAEKI